MSEIVKSPQKMIARRYPIFDSIVLGAILGFKLSMAVGGIIALLLGVGSLNLIAALLAFLSAFVFGVIPSVFLGGVMGGVIGIVMHLSDTPLSESKVIILGWGMGLLNVIFLNSLVTWRLVNTTDINQMIEAWGNRIGLLLCCPSIFVLMATGWMVRRLNQSDRDIL